MRILFREYLGVVFPSSLLPPVSHTEVGIIILIIIIIIIYFLSYWSFVGKGGMDSSSSPCRRPSSMVRSLFFSMVSCPTCIASRLQAASYPAPVTERAGSWGLIGSRTDHLRNLWVPLYFPSSKGPSYAVCPMRDSPGVYPTYQLGKGSWS